MLFPDHINRRLLNSHSQMRDSELKGTLVKICHCVSLMTFANNDFVHRKPIKNTHFQRIR